MNMQMIKNFVNSSLSLSVYSMPSLLHFSDLLLLFLCQRKFLSLSSLGHFSFGFLFCSPFLFLLKHLILKTVARLKEM